MALFDSPGYMVYFFDLNVFYEMNQHFTDELTGSDQNRFWFVSPAGIRSVLKQQQDAHPSPSTWGASTSPHLQPGEALYLHHPGP